MLTRCVEKGREKCDHYWPYDTQPSYYGDIQVTILNESQFSKWTISEFKVSKVNTLISLKCLGMCNVCKVFSIEMCKIW